MFKFILLVAAVVTMAMIETEANPFARGPKSESNCGPSVPPCPMDCITKVIVENTGCSRCICDEGNSTQSMPMGIDFRRRRSAHCAPSVECADKGGHCVLSSDKCHGGTVNSNACPGFNCVCCIKKMSQVVKTMKQGYTINNDQECKKKKSCKGFCIKKDEPCQGVIDPKGCKGRHCVCCTQNDTNTGSGNGDPSHSLEGISPDKLLENLFGDNSTDGYEEPCFGKNVNGSCKNEGCFICGDDQCLPPELKCNMITDCMDGSDEKNCTYPDDIFEGYPKKIIRDLDEGYVAVGHGERCHGKNDNGRCKNQGCFICGDGQCWPPAFKCDWIKDCTDGSDERNCSYPTPDGPEVVSAMAPWSPNNNKNNNNNNTNNSNDKWNTGRFLGLG